MSKESKKLLLIIGIYLIIGFSYMMFNKYPREECKSLRIGDYQACKGYKYCEDIATAPRFCTNSKLEFMLRIPTMFEYDILAIIWPIVASIQLFCGMAPNACT